MYRNGLKTDNEFLIISISYEYQISVSVIILLGDYRMFEFIKLTNVSYIEGEVIRQEKLDSLNHPNKFLELADGKIN